MLLTPIPCRDEEEDAVLGSQGRRLARDASVVLPALVVFGEAHGDHVDPVSDAVIDRRPDVRRAVGLVQTPSGPGAVVEGRLLPLCCLFCVRAAIVVSLLNGGSHGASLLPRPAYGLVAPSVRIPTTQLDVDYSKAKRTFEVSFIYSCI